MSAKKGVHKLHIHQHPNVRVNWDRKPQTKVKPSGKLYKRERTTFMDEKFKGL